MKGHLIEGRKSIEGGWPSAQPDFALGQPVQALAIELLSWLSQKPFHGGTKENLYKAGLMIDGGDDVIKTELQVREQQIVLSDGRKCFKFADEVVAEVPDGSATKIWQAWRRFDLRGSE
jgi:hypothetical protein